MELHLFCIDVSYVVCGTVWNTQYDVNISNIDVFYCTKYFILTLHQINISNEKWFKKKQHQQE